VLVGDEWFEVDLCQNTLLVPRPTILGALEPTSTATQLQPNAT